MLCIDLAQTKVAVLMYSKLPWGLASLQVSHRSRVGCHHYRPTAATQQSLVRANLIRGTGLARDIVRS